MTKKEFQILNSNLLIINNDIFYFGTLVVKISYCRIKMPPIAS